MFMNSYMCSSTPQCAFSREGPCVRESSGVLLVNLKTDVMHYENIHLHQSKTALTCLFQPYILAFSGLDIHPREHALI